MNISEAIHQEAIFLGCAILSGVILFLLYDILRIFRRLFAHGTVLIAIEDFFYWMICTGVVFVLLYRGNDGMVRGVAFGGIIVGMALYYIMCSRYVIRLNVFLFGSIGRILKRILKVMFGPFFKVWKKVAGFLIKRLKKAGRAIKMGLCKR